MPHLVTTIGLLFFCTSVSVHAQDTPWARHVIDDSYSGADGVRLADVNNDGLMDIATGWEEGGRTKVYINPGYEGVKDPWPAVLVAETPDVEDAVFADLDGDGAVDVISSTEGKTKKIFVNQQLLINQQF